MGNIINLQDRAVYGLGQVDGILGLRSGTAKRWIDGYDRAGRHHPPVVRPETTGIETVTWGEFVEARLLSEFRDAGVPIIRMRPAVERLRTELNTRYPLASAQTWLGVEGRELVRQVQEDVGLDRRLSLVIVRNGQTTLDWSDPVWEFVGSLEWDQTGVDAVPSSLRPLPDVPEVLVNPLRSYGEPAVRGVRTDIIGELYRAGEPIEMIAETYDLAPALVQAAVRYELKRLPQAS